MNKLICVVALVVGGFTFPADAAPMAPQANDEQTQAKHSDLELMASQGIEPTADSIAKYLEGLEPDETLIRQAKGLIDKLGNSDYEVRDSATRRLLGLPSVPLALLRKTSMSSPSPEARYRAAKILHDPKTAEKLAVLQQRNEIVRAVLNTVRDRKIANTTGAILKAAAFLEDDLTDCAGDAVEAVAASSDLPLLRRAAAGKANESTNARVVAIRGLGKAAGQSAIEKLKTYCEDANERISLSAAHALAGLADPSAIDVLIGLLVSENVEVRARSLQILRGFTKHNFKFNPYVDPDKQSASIERWKDWRVSDAPKANLSGPLLLMPLAEDLRYGLVMHFAFDQDLNSKVQDASGHGRHGTLENETQLVARGNGKALRLGGSGHHGDQGGHAVIPFIEFPRFEEFTLAVWVRESGMSHPEGEAYVTFGTDRGSSIKDAVGIAHFNDRLIFRAGGGEVSVPFADKDREKWTHYAITFSHGKLRAYHDAKLVGETPATVLAVGNRAALGRHWWADGAGTSTRFQGALDDVRVYDRALTDGQIRQLVKEN